jgi:epimerase transport system membrane fusion protein
VNAVGAAATAAPIVPLPGDDRRLRLAGYGVIGVVFLGFGGWAGVAPLDSAAVAPAVVAVESSRKTVQHLEGGIVQTLNVREGQMVQAGEVLLELEGRQFRAELDVLRAQRLNLAAQEARLLAERDGLAAVRYPDVAGLAADDARVLDARHGQDTLFKARRRSHEGEVAMLRQTVSQLRAQVSGLASVQSSKKSLIASYEGEITDLQALIAEGFVNRQKLRDYERNVTTLRGELAELHSSAAAAQAKIGETELRMLQVEREFQTAVATELGEVQAKLSDLNERFGAADDRVARALIRAPVSGRVLRLQVHTLGGVVTAGQPLMDIVPEKEELILEGRVAPVDIDRVRAGLGATIRFSSFRRDEVPDIRGTVQSVSADRLVDEASGTAFFLARVGIDAAERERLRTVALQPGMPAEIMINTGARTLLGYLWEPLGDSIARSFRED